MELERADTPTPSMRRRLWRGVLLRCRREPAIKALLAQGIGRALVGLFRGHWWGIGGHWGALEGIGGHWPVFGYFRAPTSRVELGVNKTLCLM